MPVMLYQKHILCLSQDPARAVEGQAHGGGARRAVALHERGGDP